MRSYKKIRIFAKNFYNIMKFDIKQEITLIDFVKQAFPQVSVTKAKKMILYNCFFLSGASIKSFEYVLHKGDTIEYRKYSGGLHIAKERRNVSVLYEDENIIVVNKTVNQSIIESKDKKEDTIVSLTKSYLKRKYHNNELYVIFGPQKDESGLVLMTKNKITRNALQKQQDAFIFHIAAIVENPLKHKNDKIRFFVKQTDGIYSLTNKEDEAAQQEFLQYKAVEDLSQADKTYYHINIIQHGIKPYLNRYLLNEIGNNVLNDNVFSKQKVKDKPLKYCIYCIELLRPKDSKKLRIETELPKNFTYLPL